MRQAFVAAIAFVGFSASAFAEGNPDLGKKFFKKCVSCQAIEEGKRKLGPSLFGIVGRQAGNVEGFKYSKPMSAADFFELFIGVTDSVAAHDSLYCFC